MPGDTRCPAQRSEAFRVGLRPMLVPATGFLAALGMTGTQPGTAATATFDTRGSDLC